MSTWTALLLMLDISHSLDNGVALLPIMGWLSWERFLCTTNCSMYPNHCVNAQLYTNMADRLANDGWKEVGYTFINIDDCWSLKEREKITNKQVADPQRFPDGIKGVADYVHSLGLKLGLYTDIGSHTCAGYTGIDGHYELDANTFASWGIDMIKVDGCHANISEYHRTYPMFGAALNRTGKAIVYSCSWPAYVPGHGESVNPIVDNTTLTKVAKHCNLWRNFNDIYDVWGPANKHDTTQEIIEFWSRDYSSYANNQFLSVAGAGQWNDPDMIIGGDNGLSISEAQTQFCLWAIFAAPLLMGNDLRSISAEFKELLQNREIIAINQDLLRKQGSVIEFAKKHKVYMRQLADNDSIAIVLQNNGTTGFGVYVTFDASMVPEFVDGWRPHSSFRARNVLNHSDLGIFDAQFTDLIEPSSVGMYKLTPLKL